MSREEWLVDLIQRGIARGLPAGREGLEAFVLAYLLGHAGSDLGFDELLDDETT